MLLVPQAATVEMQDKVFVFRLDKSERSTARRSMLSGKSGDSYIAGGELKPGDVIVTSGLGRPAGRYGCQAGVRQGASEINEEAPP